MSPLLIFWITLSIFLDYGERIISAEPLLGHNVRKAESNEFPFIVSLQRRKYSKTDRIEKSHFCCGTLITRQHVLTSAHCFVKGLIATEIEIIINSIDLNVGKSYDVSEVITYNAWAQVTCLDFEDIEGDLAILKLSKCVSRNIKLPTLSKELNIMALEKTAELAGWGMTNKGSKSRYLLTAAVQIVDKTVCEMESRKFIYVERICTKGNPYTLVGKGDSGGPLIINKDVIVGVNAAYIPSRQNYPKIPDTSRMNLHVSVAKYAEFIKTVIKRMPVKCSIV